jgi:hypothetical protein
MAKIKKLKYKTMTREELKKELKNIKTIYCVGITRGTNPNWDKGIWRTFRLYYIKDGELRQIFPTGEEAEKLKTWKAKKGVFESRVLGMDRCFNILMDLTAWLGFDDYKFKEEFLSWE